MLSILGGAFFALMFHGAMGGRPAVTVTDIGTLGGDRSVALAVNNRGHAAGASFTRSGENHAFFWSRATGILDLGTLGGNTSSATSINENGQVAGWSLTASGETHAFLWTRGQGMRDLGVLGGTSVLTFSQAFVINDLGVVAGASSTAAGPPEDAAFFWSRDAGMRSLGGMGGAVDVKAINNHGDVAGHAATGTGFYRAFLSENGGELQDLGTLGGPFSFANAVNKNGDVAGSSATASGNTHAVIWWKGNGTTDLGALGGASTSAAVALNDRGEAAGYTSTASNATHAFYWNRDRGMVDIGVLGSHLTPAHSEAVAINANGAVSGASTTFLDCNFSGCFHAFVWTRSAGLVDLGTLGGNVKGFQSSAKAMNDYGQIVGDSTAPNGGSRAVLWTLR